MQQFDLEEDFILLTYLRFNNDISLSDYLNDFPLKPYHSLSSIEKRLNELEHMSEEQKISLIKSISERIAKEQLLSDSFSNSEIHPPCISHFYERFPTTTATNDAIHSLSSHFNLIIDGIFDIGELAVLRSENFLYHMKRESVLIGRRTHENPVDIDLNYEIPPNCSHISRKQAILSFAPDFEFYIQNIGLSSFRVNGIIIESQTICKLQIGALLDFADVLLMFIPNVQFINELKQSHPLEKEKKNTNKKL